MNNYLTRGAVVSDCKRYRYSLDRQWDERKRRVLFIMLNPSVADGTLDDPTIRRCVSFAVSVGGGSLEVVNLFAFRATDPGELDDADDPVGPDNDRYIERALRGDPLVIAAWGTHPMAHRPNPRVSRSRVVAGLAGNFGVQLHTLFATKDGAPSHPLYLSAERRPVPYEVPRG